MVDEAARQPVGHNAGSAEDAEWSPLHVAAKAGDHKSCIDLLTNGADPNVRGLRFIKDGPLYRDWYWEPGSTPLILAAEGGFDKVVALLLDYGADPTLVDQHGWGAVHAAVRGGKPRVTQRIVEAGGSVDGNCSIRHFDEELGWFFINTPLHLASLRNDVASGEVLLNAGADTMASWIDKRTPLIYAAARGNDEMVSLLSARGADVNLREHRHEYVGFVDYAPLHYAARNGHVSTYELLIQLGGECGARDSYSGMTAEEMLVKHVGSARADNSVDAD